jgi:hypothetical protein
MRYYFKKATNQDVTRTTVLNTEALEHFFQITLLERDDEGYIDLRYFPNAEGINTRIVLKQDPRIFIDKSNLEPNDLIFFERLGENLFGVRFIKENNPEHSLFLSLLNTRNYALIV